MAESKTVMVTGATGFIASWLVKLLLEKGYTVHGTVRDPANKEKTKHLLALPNASDKLHLFKADLLEEGSYDEAIKGCGGVFHTASPFFTDKPTDPEKELIEPAVKGTLNVLKAAKATPSVKRVVLTSSVAAVYGDPNERGKGHVFTEEDWTIAAKEQYIPYYYSKTVAEKKAWEMVKQQSRWDLVTILPGAVFGPPLSSRKSGESVGMLQKFIEGKNWPAVPPMGFGCVDVDDIASAHALAAFTPSASGRYLAAPESLWMLDIGNILKEKYPDRWLPKFGYMPYLMLWAAAPLVGMGRDFIHANYGKLPVFNSEKAPRELGIKWTPIKTTLQEMAARELKLGIAK